VKNQVTDPACRGPNDRRSIIVLLVDDQPFVGAAVGRLLETEQNIHLRCCHAAVDAIAVANQINPTIILQDLVMPDLDGLVLVGLFRGNPTTANTPVIVLSGNDDSEARARAFAAGANDYLVKLPPKEDLIKCIRQHAVGRETEAPGAFPDQQGCAETDGGTLDPQLLATFRQAGACAEFALTLIDQFVQEADLRVTALRDAATRLDVKALKAAAHGLRGSSMIIGARRLAVLCARLESEVRALSSNPGVLAAAIDEELVRVRAALAVERQSIARSGSPSVTTTATRDPNPTAR
jgi:DNA-binding response OmpR family regulator